ncbi:hypothetical protein V2J09_001699 [Rumex salicifolius]
MQLTTFTFLLSCIFISHNSIANAKVYLVLMDGLAPPFASEETNSGLSGDAKLYKQRVEGEHDNFLGSLLEANSYRKLYSYTHLLNGFAIHVDSEQMTTHTPEYLGISSGVWPTLGGARNSGNGVVIGMIDTGVNPNHPSFSRVSSPISDRSTFDNGKFKGSCSSGDQFPPTACGDKIVGAQYFARGATVVGDFNATRDYAHTASTAAGNHDVPVIVNGFNYGYASGMAPGAKISVYKAVYSFGGYMSDVVAAVDQAVEDGVDIINLSVAPSSVPPGASAFLNVLEVQLLFAMRAGVVVIQAVGNGGPSPSSVLSFSPWITSVAASKIDRKYNISVTLAPTPGEVMFPIAAAADVSRKNSSVGAVESCQDTGPFIPSLVQGKLIICTYTYDFELETASIFRVAETMRSVGAAGFIMTMDPDVNSDEVKGTAVTLQVPGIILNDLESSEALRQYYNARTFRSRSGRAVAFTATGKILEGREAIYTGQAPVVASYSSRGPDVNNAVMQTADVLKPSITAPGSSIWAAWSPDSLGDQYVKGQNFALVSGTSMAAPHVAGVAALIKQKHPGWSPSAIISAMMTTADVTDPTSAPILAQQSKQLVSAATPFDYGSGVVNATRAMDPGLVFITQFWHYIEFLCAVPGVDDDSIRRAVGVGCPKRKRNWCSDLNGPTVTVADLVGSRKVARRVTSVAGANETYRVTVREPLGVRVTVSPRVFKITPNSSRHLNIVLQAVQAMNSYTFGEVVLSGSRDHVVRLPVVVFVSSVLGS